MNLAISKAVANSSRSADRFDSAAKGKKKRPLDSFELIIITVTGSRFELPVPFLIVLA